MGLKVGEVNLNPPHPGYHKKADDNEYYYAVYDHQNQQIANFEWLCKVPLRQEQVVEVLQDNGFPTAANALFGRKIVCSCHDTGFHVEPFED